MKKKYKIILAVLSAAVFVGLCVFLIIYLFNQNHQREILYEDSFANDMTSIAIAGSGHEDGIAVPGEVITYRISLKNTGAIDVSDLILELNPGNFFEFIQEDTKGDTIKGGRVVFENKGIVSGQEFIADIDLKLKSPLDNNMEIDQPSAFVQYEKVNQATLQKVQLSKELKPEKTLKVSSSPDFSDSSIRVVQSKDKTFMQTSLIKQGSKIFIEVFIKNSGNMDSSNITISLGSIQGLILESSHGNFLNFEAGEDSINWAVNELKAGQDSFYMLEFNAGFEEDARTILPYLKISCPQENPANFTESANEDITFEGSSIEVSKKSPGKIYASDILQAKVLVRNFSDEDAESVTVEIEVPDEAIVSENSLKWEIEKIESGQTVYLTGLLEVIPDIGSDKNVKCLLKINSSLGVSSTFESNQLIISQTEYFKGGTIPVIALHGIEPEAQGRYEISTEVFEYMLRLLKTHGYETITFSDLFDYKAGKKNLPLKPVIITTDDGYESIYKYAYPILLKYDYQMSIFVSTGYIGGDLQSRMMNEFDFKYDEIPKRNMMIWPEIIKMANNGMEIGSHGIYHLEYATLSFEEVVKMLTESRQEIEDKLKRNCLFFAWPHDSVHPEVLAVMADIGYVGAIRYKGGPEDTNTIDFYNIKRINIESPIPKEAYAELFMIDDDN